MRSSQHGLLAGVFATALVVGWAAPAAAQWDIESKDGKSNIKIGFLAQPQLESLESPDNTNTSENIFLRRFRILFGGKVSDKWTFFFETDSPNIGKSSGGVKDAGTIFLQDAVLTYNQSAAFKVDVGLILLGQDHNHLQSAASLLPVDYGPYTFLESGPLQERVGRDYGVEVRGYPFKEHLEYRLGVYQGLRGTDGNNPFRWVGRVVYYPFASDNGLFYAGTFQGQKRLIGIGASFDYQKESSDNVAPDSPGPNRYAAYGVDAFVEQPINGGEQGLTAQFDYLRLDGGSFITALPKQNTYLVEAGFHFGKGHYTPFVQYAARSYVSPASTTLHDTNQWQVGFAWWMSANHARNFKVSAGRLHTDGIPIPNRTLVLAQLQIFFF
jgi:hypothetical protein